MVPSQRVTGVDALLALEADSLFSTPLPSRHTHLNFPDIVNSKLASVLPDTVTRRNDPQINTFITLPKALKSEEGKKNNKKAKVLSSSETDPDDESVLSQTRRRKRVKKQKKNKPKKAMTPFMVFSKDTRKVLVSENPAMTFSDIGKELGARWRNLSEADREIYKIKAGQDYQRFLNETEQLESLNPNRKRKTVEQKKQTKVKKSISAYLYFCNAHREQMKAIHPDMKMVEIQRLLADRWMNAPQPVKMPFEKQAEADREKFNSDLSMGIDPGFEMSIDEDEFLKLENDSDEQFYDHHDDDEHLGDSEVVHSSDTASNMHELFSLHRVAQNLA